MNLLAITRPVMRIVLISISLLFTAVLQARITMVVTSPTMKATPPPTTNTMAPTKKKQKEKTLNSKHKRMAMGTTTTNNATTTRACTTKRSYTLSFAPPTRAGNVRTVLITLLI